MKTVRCGEGGEQFVVGREENSLLWGGRRTVCCGEGGEQFVVGREEDG